MGFFDDLGGRITSVGNQMTSKGQNAKETWDLNNQIKALQNQIAGKQSQIQQHYMVLGEWLYEEKRNSAPAQDYESEFLTIDQLNADIDALNTQIDGLQAQIVAIQSQVTCPVCGKSVDADAAFCLNCGSPITHMQPQAPDYAAQGYAGQAAPAYTAAQPVQQAQPMQAASAAGRMCPKCNALVEAGAMFCMNCGNKL